MRRSRMIKIVATLGPASHTHDHLHALFLAGVDVFRINMSHTDACESEDAGRHGARGRGGGRAADLHSGRSAGTETAPRQARGRASAPGAARRVTFVRSETASTARPSPSRTRRSSPALKAGSHLLIDDGKVRLTALEVGPDRMTAEVIQGGVVKDHKGVNLPDTLLPIPALTPKDRADLDYALRCRSTGSGSPSCSAPTMSRSCAR